MVKRAGRRLLVSPWFAAGAGVVIATAAIVIVPHDLSFQGAIRVHHCKQLGCAAVSPEGVAAGKPADTGGGPLTASPNPPSALAGVTFLYQPLEQSSQYGFSMVIVIHATHSLGPWKLSFMIPGATDVFVVSGARWQQSSISTSGGTASNYFGGTESAGYAMISGHQSGADFGSGRSDTVQFTIRGTGTAQKPVDCYYDGVACSFKLADDLAAANWPGSV